MRIISDIDYTELTDPDLTAGELRETVWASPEAYASIDNVTKHALSDEDYETVQLYHRWTEQELAERAAGVAMAERQAIINGLPEVVSAMDVEQEAYATDTDAALFDLTDYVAELEARIAALEA